VSRALLGEASLRAFQPRAKRKQIDG